MGALVCCIVLGATVARAQLVTFNDHPPIINDQIPCMLNDQQNYASRGLVVTRPSAADAINKAVQKVATAPTTSPATKAVSAHFLQLFTGYASASDSAVKAAVPGLIQQAASEADVKDATESAAASASVAGTVQGALAASSVQPPKDVSCSMSVLSWDETHKALGRTIADTYLVVQITVRNLDANNEFLVHFAELAVDANGARLSRFQVGHEKELARSVLQYGQSYDRQHVFINIAEGIGTIMGAIVGLPQPSIDALTGATGAYHAGLLPFLHVLAPDLTTRNLNTLNDLAFSAANASRIVVPKSGSVPFIVLIPVFPLEQACWLADDYNIAADSYPLNAADGKNICGEDGTKQSMVSKRIPLKHWSPVQMQALELHSYAVVAGVHIKQTGQAAQLNGITCNVPVDTAGAYLQYLIPSGGLSCSLTGTDLDTVTTLRLKAADDAKKTLDAKVTVSGDNTTATAALAASDTANITKPVYELFGVDKTNSEHDFGRTISFRLPPTIDDTQTVPAAGTATLKGTNLNGITAVYFYDSADATEKTHVSVLTTTGAAVTFTVPPAAALPACPAATPSCYSIRLQIDDGKSTIFKTGKSVSH
jgi:hypothetical protein